MTHQLSRPIHEFAALVTAPIDLSASDEWSTPPELFAALSSLYGPFDVDAAAAAWNHKAPLWCGLEGSPWGSAFEVDWARPCWPASLKPLRVWCNPPYSRGSLDRWVSFWREQVVLEHVQLVTLLVPHYTAEGWWRHVECPAGEVLGATVGDTQLGPRTQVRSEHLTTETLRIRGRVRYVEKSGATGPARHSSAAVTFARRGVLLPLGGRTPRGPKPVVTPAVEHLVNNMVENGHSIARACELAGIGRKTWYRHLERKALGPAKGSR